MADVKANTEQYTTAANDRVIYQGGQSGTGQIWAFQTEALTSWDGTITVQRRLHTDNPATTPAPWLAVPYQKYNLNSTVADGTFVSTGITGSSFFQVDATGSDIALSIASRTVGSVTITRRKVRA